MTSPSPTTGRHAGGWSGDPWEFLAVPNTTTSVGYPVNEIVSVITD